MATVAGGSEGNTNTEVSSTDDVRLEPPSDRNVATTGVDSAGVPLSFQGPSVVLPNVKIITGTHACMHIVYACQ